MIATLLDVLSERGASSEPTAQRKAEYSRQIMCELTGQAWQDLRVVRPSLLTPGGLVGWLVGL